MSSKKRKTKEASHLNKQLSIDVLKASRSWRVLGSKGFNEVRLQSVRLTSNVLASRHLLGEVGSCLAFVEFLSVEAKHISRSCSDGYVRSHEYIKSDCFRLQGLWLSIYLDIKRESSSYLHRTCVLRTLMPPSQPQRVYLKPG